MHVTSADILGHARLDTTQIYTQVSLNKLLETHQKTDPAEQPEPQLPPGHPGDDVVPNAKKPL